MAGICELKLCRSCAVKWREDDGKRTNFLISNVNAVRYPVPLPAFPKWLV